MYVMIDDVAVPLASGAYFAMMSKGKVIPLPGSGVLPATGGELTMLYIGVMMVIVTLAFFSAFFAAKALNRQAHATK